MHENRDEKGKFIYDYIVYEIPNINPQGDFRLVDLPYTDFYIQLII